MVSLAQSAFVMMAAFTAGRVLSEYNWPWAAALLAGTVIAMLLGIVVALPALRLGGLPLALATLALSFMGDRVLFKWDWLRNGQGGWKIDRPELGPFDLIDRKSMIVFVAIILALLVWLVHNLDRSASGRAIISVRNSEPAAATSGMSIPATKLRIFALSAAVAGFGGVLLATNNGGISDSTFVTQTGLAWLAAVVLFGIRKPQGAIIAGLVTASSGAIFSGGWHFAFTPSFLHWDGLGSSTSTYVAAALFGVGAVQLAREPDGVLALTAAQNRARRDKRRAKALAGAGTTEEFVSGADPGAVERELEREAASRIRPAVIIPTENPSGEVALSVRDLHSGYGLVEVLHGISLEIVPGRITAVLGPNGAGKSTLCQTIAGLVAVSGGQLIHRGDDITKTQAYQRAKRKVVLAPESRGVFPALSVKENLQLWLPDAADRERAYERFPILGERRNLPAGSLSGGEQQMLTLVPLLVNPPDVLIADEPSLGLAPIIVAEIMTLFVELRGRGVALVLVEEKAKSVLEIADTVSFLSLGRMSWSGPKSAVDDKLLAQVYLGHAEA